MNLSSYLSKNTLDWMTGAAAATQPVARWAAVRDSVSSEIGSRVTALFGAAASPTQSASNTASLLFGPLSASGVVFELAIFDSPVGSTNLLWSGPLAEPRTFLPGSVLTLRAGDLVITLS
ncbi:MAG TPA: hypothetical protein VGJ76_03520 [Pseudolabrys sp.]|jgi:hypothetical protein